jgi:hypothetical protein
MYCPGHSVGFHCRVMAGGSLHPLASEMLELATLVAGGRKIPAMVAANSAIAGSQMSLADTWTCQCSVMTC